MNLKLQRIQRILRDAHLLTPVEKVRYLFSMMSLYRQNKDFIAAHPDFELPPAHLAYDAYSAPHWSFYKTSGQQTAQFLATTVKRHGNGASSPRILEWGCGPGRVIRHVPDAFNDSAQVFGSDYNPESIAWCTRAIPRVTFIQNGLHPPLHAESDFFDVAYSISVFTHLSESVCNEWIAELHRVIRPGGILIITTNGDSIIPFMLPDEKQIYSTKGYVTRDKFEEGKKMFFACHAPAYLRQHLFKEFEILEHVPASFPHTGQDYWILRKPAAR